MTTAAAPFTALTVPAPEDTMEISSPANRPIDEDIEIDFDEDQPAPPAEDDYMLEDTTRPTTATDELMDDDLQHAHDAALETVNEEVMQDDVAGVGDDTVTGYDEELIDYGEEDEGFQDDVGHHADVLNDTDPLFPTSDVAVDATVQEVVEEKVHPVEDTKANVTALDANESAAGQDINGRIFTSARDEAPAEDDFEAHSEGGDAEQVVEEPFVDEHEESYDEQTAPEAEPEQLPLTVDTTATTTEDGPDTPTDTGLHPVTVRYHDQEMPLFKSKRQIDGLLKSDNLASLSLSSLAEDCRRQLLKRDHTISEDQDIVLNFDQLGLMLVEDCHAAFDTSLHEVLEVYLQLHHNEGWQEIAPLSLTLSTQLKFQSSFTFLKSAAELGQGISQFAFLTNRREGAEQRQAFDEDGEFEEHNLDEDNHDAGDEEDDETTELEHEHEHGTDAYNTVEWEPYPDGQQEHDESHEETDEQHVLPDDHGEAAEALDGLTGETALPEDDAAGNEATAEDEGTVLQHGQTEETAASTASSATMEGDKDTANSIINNSTVGKYFDEELIDWDDEDYLTSDTSDDSHSGPDHDTLNTDYETRVEEKGHTDDQQHLASEDWLDETPSKEVHVPPHQEADGQQLYADGPMYAEDEEDGADNTDQQEFQGDEQFYHPDYQPEAGEEEDLYHTAHEGFFEGQEYEHGVEHTEFDQENDHELRGEGYDEETEFDDTVLIHPQPEEGQEELYEEDNVQAQQQDPNEFEDEINFDEDDDELQHPHTPTADTAAVEIAGQTSPRSKRSFDEVDDFDDEAAALELPEVKKVRAS